MELTDDEIAGLRDTFLQEDWIDVEAEKQINALCDMALAHNAAKRGEPVAWQVLNSDGKIVATRTDKNNAVMFRNKWENELSTVSKLERERDALREEVSRLTENQRQQDSATAFVMERDEKERDALRREVEELKPFKDAIDDQMIILHLGTADTYPAKQCLDEIINWQVSISLDPQVSSDAAALRDTHLERAEAAERELAACRDDAELFRFVFSKPRKIDGVFDATFDEKTQQPSASFRSIDLTPIGREWDSDSDSLNRLRAAIKAKRGK